MPDYWGHHKRVTTACNVHHLVKHLREVEGDLEYSLEEDRKKCYAFM